MSEVEEAIDLGCARAAESMVGKDFQSLMAKMKSNGYHDGKVVSNRKEGTSTVFVTKGSHETRLQYKITFNWREKCPGMLVLDQVVACKWIEPLRPEPFEVR